MLTLDKLSKSFGEKIIIENSSFQFPKGERIAIAGPNGAGKTTLLNILCGIEEADSGSIRTPSDFQIAYLPQEPSPTPEPTVLKEAQSGSRKIFSLQKKLEESLRNLESQHSPEAINYHEQLEAEYQMLGGYSLEAKTQAILNGLGFRDGMIEQSPLELSGGWRMRIELAKIFVTDPDILILDEPTNHLDLPSLVWVEGFLQSFRGTLIFVSHDRSLLNRLANHTIFLSQGQLESFPFPFDRALEARSQRLEEQAARKQNLAKKREKMEQFVERFGAKATKARQAQSRVKMISKILELEDSLHSESDSATVSFKLPTPPPSGKVVLELKDLSIGYSTALSKNLLLTLERQQKIAIIGANGIGKSTLLKTITGSIRSLAGSVSYGHNVEVAYFSQNHADALNLNQNCIENVMSVSEHVGEQEARSVLGSFLFSGDDSLKKVGVLSGGEKGRVSLARILVQRANCLILDEPTNHLDMASVAALSNALLDYQGSVLFVSHDREFINSFCTHVFVMLPDGGSMLFEGDLDDYQRLAQQANFPNVLRIDEDSPSSTKAKKTSSSQQTREQMRVLKKQRNAEEKKLKKAEEQEESLRKKRSKLEKLLEELNPDDYEKLGQVQADIDLVDQELDECESRWLEHSEIIESLDNQIHEV